MRPKRSRFPFAGTEDFDAPSDASIDELDAPPESGGVVAARAKGASKKGAAKKPTAKRTKAKAAEAVTTDAKTTAALRATIASIESGTAPAAVSAMAPYFRLSLARALYDAGRYAEARAAFRELVAADPADDYALFGYGLSAGRLGNHREAVEQLALAAAMRPEVAHYGRALRRARAALTAQQES